jgi:hypothetical protein
MYTITQDEADDIVYSDKPIAVQEVSKHRWYTLQLVVYRDTAGELVGFHYCDPASELQEGQDRYETDPVQVFPVISREVTHIVYEMSNT